MVCLFTILINMKMHKYPCLFFIVCFYISCISIKGNKYYSVYTNYPLTMVFLNDSTSVLYYSNSSSVAKIHFSIDTIDRSKGFIGTVKHVDIFDTLIYDYLNKNLPRKDTIRNQLICDGNMVMVLKNIVVFVDDKENLYLKMYSKHEKKKVIKYSNSMSKGIGVYRR